MRPAQSLILISLLSIAATSATAASIPYTVTFFAATGLAPTSASFDFDASATPGSQFSSFIVVWDGVTFDLTSGANHPSHGTACGSTSADVFVLLTTNSDCSTHISGFPQWAADLDPSKGGAASFDFLDVATSGGGLTVLDSLNPSYSGAFVFANGTTWTVQSSDSTPEPASIFLTLTGAALILAKRHKSD